MTDQERLAQQQKMQFEADKQSALEQGYTEEQAIKYAQQEAYLAQMKREAPQAPAEPESGSLAKAPPAKKPEAKVYPAAGPTTAPPSHEGQQ